MSTASQVSKFYLTVVNDVINNVKDAFLDEGVDEQVLLELKQLWEGKLAASKALEPLPTTNQDVIAPSLHIMLPQALHTATQEQGAFAQQSHTQATPQYQISPAAPSLALPAGLFQQHQLGALQNITFQQTSTGQLIAITPQQLAQLQHQSLQPQLAPHISQQMLQHQMQLSKQQTNLPKQQPQAKLLQAGQHGPAGLASQPNIIQMDGNADTSSSDDDFDDDDKDDDDKDDDDKEEEVDEEGQGEEEDPLNSGDDVSEEDPAELFDTENVVVCQYDKINRNKNKWKFHLKDGIMNLNGRDFVFQKATGDSEW